MCTSLGNGFTNLMLMKFWAFKHGETVDGVVEGDDGLFATRSGKVPEKEFFASLGMRLKLDVADDLSKAGFCSMTFSVLTKRVLANPMKKLVALGWTFSPLRFSARKRIELLRAKALSMLCSSPGSPIVDSCARWVLRSLGQGPVSFSGLQGSKDWYEQQIDYSVAEKPPIPIAEEDRLLVAAKYGVPVSHQLAVERYFDSCNTVCTIPFWVVNGFVPFDCISYHVSHVHTCAGPVARWKEF